jgi:hypothetical protein
MTKATARCIVFGSSLLASAALCQTPEQRAIKYLSVEVPKWAVENKCYSCHNNGDGARALYTAICLGHDVPRAALADTTKWLIDPRGWDKGRADASISDKKLARIQFAVSLGLALDSRVAADEQALIAAAEFLVRDQSEDGSWEIEGENNVGSPATYGTTLATMVSMKTLERAGETRFAAAIAKAKRWLSETEPANTLDAAAIFLAIPGRREALLTRIVQGQTSRGGWGPQRYAPPEPFDTAVVLLALQQLNNPKRTADLVKRGREYLIVTQQPSGGWQETTRPAGAQSYAQHISTTAWATLALLATDPERK